MIYRLLCTLLRHALRIFFNRIEIEGLEDVPEQGPLLLAANHPNTLIDVLLVSTTLDRQVGFVAKAPLFKNFFAGALLRFLGAVPVFRRIDGPLDDAAKERNQSALAACEEAVAEGRAILIFPEGVSLIERRLKRLKTGLARIALGAAGRTEQPVKVVPVALLYDDPESFRSRARIHFSPAIDVTPYQQMAGEDEFASVRALTEAVRASLEAEAVHVEDEQHEPLLEELDILYGGAVEDQAGSRLRATNVIANALNHFRESEPERVERVRGALKEYREGLAGAGADDWVVRLHEARPGVGATLLFWFSLPLAVWGILNHFVLYHIPRVVLKLVPVDPEYNATVKLLTGLLALVATYVVQGYGLFWLSAHYQLAASPWTPTLLYLGTLPLFGMIALLWWEGLEARVRRARTRGRRRNLDLPTLERLRELRGVVVQELDQARPVYLAATAEAPEEEEDELL